MLIHYLTGGSLLVSISDKSIVTTVIFPSILSPFVKNTWQTMPMMVV